MANLSLPGAHNIHRAVLANGITVYALENRAAQSVVLAGALPAGGVFEQPFGRGLANLTATALMRGTHNRSFEVIHSTLEDIGADFGLSAGYHHVGFTGKALAEDLPTLLELAADVLRRPSFPAPQVNRLRAELLTFLQYRLQDSGYRASRAFREALYPTEHAYHHPLRGTPNTLPKLTLADLAAFHQAHYAPQGLKCVIVGAVAPPAAVELVAAHFADWQATAAATRAGLPALPSRAGTERVFTPLAGKSQMDVIMGVAGPPRSSPHYHAAQLANSILGQFGMMGRIGEKVREELGLAYHVSSSLEGGLGPGAWSIQAGVNPADLERALAALQAEVRRWSTEAVTAEELADNQAYFTGHLPLQLESNEGLAAALLNIAQHDLELDHLLTISAKIHALTPDDLLAAVQTYWHSAYAVISAAGTTVEV